MQERKNIAVFLLAGREFDSNLTGRESLKSISGFWASQQKHDSLRRQKSAGGEEEEGEGRCERAPPITGEQGVISDAASAVLCYRPEKLVRGKKLDPTRRQEVVNRKWRKV